MTETDAAQQEHKRIRGRSPSYPGIDLQSAIKRARVLYDAEKRHPTPIPLVATHWGFKSHTTGPATVTYAALIKYGLLTDEGTGDGRKATLTDLAVTILESPDEAERQTAIREAALKPPIHQEMWNEYGTNLPTDSNLRYKMAIQGPFTERGFDDFIRVYRATIAFAKLDSADKVDALEPDPGEDGGADYVHDAGDPNPEGERTVRRVQRHQQQDRGVGMTEGAVQTIAVPMLGSAPIIVEGKFPLSEVEWTYFMTVLDAMKSGLVGRKQDEAEGDD